jgi:hypothetical protein
MIESVHVVERGRTHPPSYFRTAATSVGRLINGARREAMAQKRTPPYQLVPGDRFNLTLGVGVAFVLAACKDIKSLPPLLRWQFNAYTNWNLTFLALRVALKQRQWDPFLLTNSLGILLCFRTAFAQGLDDNMRRKLGGMGLKLPRWLFLMFDHAFHSLPPAVLLTALVRRRQRVHPMNSVYALSLSTWFAFRQNASLDSSKIYVPHPWKRAWVAILVGVLASPPLVDALITRRHGKVLLIVLCMLAPWLSAELDPHLRTKYHFECLLSEATQKRTDQEAARTKHGASVTRTFSECPLVMHSQPTTPEKTTPGRSRVGYDT